MGKHKLNSFNARKECPTKAGEFVYTNICEPLQTKILGGSQHFVRFKDDFLKYKRVFLISQKSEVAKCLKTFTREAVAAGNQIKESLKTNKLKPSCKRKASKQQ